MIGTNGLLLNNIVGADDVDLDAVANFDDKNVGNGKAVDLLASILSGADAGNYSLSFTGAPTDAANVTRRALTVGGSFTANNKTYDGTTAAAINVDSLVLNNTIGGDDIDLDAVASFADKNVGIGKAVDILDSGLSGVDAGNYSLNFAGAPTAAANISARALTIGGSFNANNKVYDGNRDATIGTNGLVLNNVIGGDDIDLDAVAAFANKNAGNGKTVTLLDSSLSGADMGNYTLNFAGAPSDSANITRRGLTIGGSFTVLDKTYDGTTAAVFALNNLLLNGVLGGDTVNLSAIANFASPFVGSDKSVRLTASTLAGGDAGNYNLSFGGAPTTEASIIVGPNGEGAGGDGSYFLLREEEEDGSGGEATSLLDLLRFRTNEDGEYEPTVVPAFCPQQVSGGVDGLSISCGSR